MLCNEISNFWQDSLKDPNFRFELKAQKISVDLASVFAKTGLTQKELADKLGWKTSRVSKVLHGGSNLTLKTLFDVCEALGTDFNIHFGGHSQLKQEMEIVKVKQEQIEKMMSMLWRTKGKEEEKPKQKFSPVYELVS